MRPPRAAVGKRGRSSLASQDVPWAFTFSSAFLMVIFATIPRVIRLFSGRVNFRLKPFCARVREPQSLRLPVGVFLGAPLEPSS